MRKAPILKLERYRVKGPPGTRVGSFRVPVPLSNRTLEILAGDGGGWWHVSVKSCGNGGTTIPTWAEMCFAKRLLFRDDQTVMQLHPDESEYVNWHPSVLHLWAPQTPEEMAGVRAEWEAAGEPWVWGEQPPPPPIPLPPKEFV